MAQENAKRFVEKIFTDDEFLKEIVRHGGFRSNADNEEKNALVAKAAKEMGYDFSVEEYQGAMKDYFGGSFWKLLKSLMHLNKVVKKAEKEQR